MVPRWALGIAFVAGLVPGLLLYWMAARRPAFVSTAPAPVSIDSVRPAAAAPVESKAAAEGKKASAVEKKTVVERELDPALVAEHREAMAKLADNDRALLDMREKLRESEARVAALTEQKESASGEAKGLQQELEGLQKRLASAEGLLKTREARLAEVEAAQARLQRQGSESGQRLARVGEVAGELEEIARRREGYVNAIVARYREATDLFRAISLRLDNPRDASSPLNNDLSRIQSAIQAADEDMRQLRALNAQSAKLQKELARR